MLSNWKRRGVLPMLVAGLALTASVAVACGDDDDDEDTTPTTAAGNTTAAGSPTTATSPTGGTTATSPTAGGGEIDYDELSGSVRVDGSSTVFPISEAVAEEFSQVASDVRANVAFSGTGGGFEKFCRGEIEVSDASRPIEDDEVEACAEQGLEDIIEIQVAIDALTVVVNPDNDFATCMTPEQLNLLFRDGGATRWNEIDPSWPDEAIDVYYPGADSGTFDYFVEAIIEGAAPEGEEPSHRSDGTSSEDDNVLVQGVEGSRNAIGYFGFAYYQEEGQRLKAVQVDDGNGCVEPSFETALAGEYTPLSRPLFIYTDGSILESKPEVLGFVKFYIENMNALAEEVGYISLPDDLLAEQEEKIAEYLP